MTEVSRVPPPINRHRARTEHPAHLALGLMVEALSLIDANEGPAEAGCYLDHAINYLRTWTEENLR